jgi:hypothetical protein
VTVTIPFLLLSGPPGVGKTTVSWEIFDQLVDEGYQAALADLDLLGAAWPAPPDDPYNERLRGANLQAVWQNFHVAGARCLIAAGVVESRADLDRYRKAIPQARTTLCRLHASGPELTARIVHRGRERGEEITKLTKRALYLAQELAQSDIADVVVDTTGVEIPDVARQIRARAGGWPD